MNNDVNDVNVKNVMCDAIDSLRTVCTHPNVLSLLQREPVFSGNIANVLNLTKFSGTTWRNLIQHVKELRRQVLTASMGLY